MIHSISRELRKNWSILLTLLCFSFFATFFTSGFSFLYGDFNSWSDINIYYTIGKGIFFDKVPYKDLFDHKGPIIFFLYYIGYILTPNSFQGMFLIESIFLFIQLIYIYRMAHLFLPKIYSIITSSIFALLLYSLNQTGGSAEEFILTLMTISLYYFIRYFKTSTIKHSPRTMFIHSILLTITFFIKLNLIVFWFFPILFILIYLVYKRQYNNLIKNLIALFIGISFISISIFSYFYFKNATNDFIEAYFLVNLKYGEINDIYYRFFRGIHYIYLLSRAYPFMSFYIFIGLICILFFIPKYKRILSLSIICTFILQYAIIVMVPTIYVYYFIINLVFASLGIIFCLFFIHYLLKNKEILSSVLCMIIFIGSCFLIIINKKFYNYSFNELVNRSFKDQKLQNDVTEYINSYENNDFFCIGIGHEIGVFTSTHKVPNVKYFFSPNIDQKKYPIITNKQESYIRNKTVRFILIGKGTELKSTFSKILDDNNFKPIMIGPEYTLYGY